MHEMTRVEELHIPATALSFDDADEFVRFWVAGGDSHVALRMGVFGDSELESWGMILADIARHVVEAYRDQNPIDASRAYSLIADGYAGRLAATVQATTIPLSKSN